MSAFSFRDFRVGSRLSGETHVSVANTQIPKHSNGNYTNDANGNTLTGGGRSNVWDSQNRLYQCVANGKTNRFTYGADGLRRSMTTDAITSPVTTHYLLDGQNVVQEMRDLNSNGTTEGSEATATYLAGPRGVEYRQDESTGKRSWYLYDGLGSVIAEVDEADSPNNQTGVPQITATRTYDVYGNPLISSGTTASSHKFVGGLGHTSDADTSLTYMRARYYDPEIGRFASEDPGRDGANWYGYCNENPVNLIDATGRWAIAAMIGISAVVSGLMNMYAERDNNKTFLDWAKSFGLGAAAGAATAAGGLGGPFLGAVVGAISNALVTLLQGGSWGAAGVSAVVGAVGGGFGGAFRFEMGGSGAAGLTAKLNVQVAVYTGFIGILCGTAQTVGGSWDDL